MITTGMVYWIIMLDQISKIFVLFSFGFGLFLFWFTGFTLADDKKLPKYYPILVVLELLFICAATFIPNTKQMATIYLLPKVINNEKIQSIGERTLDVGDKLLQLTQQYITEKLIDEGK